MLALPTLRNSPDWTHDSEEQVHDGPTSSLTSDRIGRSDLSPDASEASIAMLIELKKNILRLRSAENRVSRATGSEKAHILESGEVLAPWESTPCVDRFNRPGAKNVAQASSAHQIDQQARHHQAISESDLRSKTQSGVSIFDDYETSRHHNECSEKY
jgi:hypothetical protein